MSADKNQLTPKIFRNKHDFKVRKSRDVKENTIECSCSWVVVGWSHPVLCYMNSVRGKYCLQSAHKGTKRSWKIQT